MTIQLDSKILGIKSSKDLLQLIVDIQTEAIKGLTDEDFFEIYPHIMGSLELKESMISDYSARVSVQMTQLGEFLQRASDLRDLQNGITSKLRISSRWYNTLKHILFYLEPSILTLLRKDGPTYVREVWEFFFREDESRREVAFFAIKYLKQ